MARQELLTSHETRFSGFTVTVTAHPVVNLALVHNRVPIIQRISVRNDGTLPLHEIEIAARIDGLADGTSPSWSDKITQLAPASTVTREVIRDVVPDRAHLEHLSEAYDAELVVAVTVNNRTDSVTADLSILASNEWFAAGFCFESLASFVEPNSPAVSALLGDASDILQANTGDSSLQGYQAGPQRAGLIAAAIYAALANREIRYIEPPASFELSGQKVRDPHEVLATRFGTCLDLSVLYASCLEAAGIHPLIWVIDGHAFVGFHRDDKTLPTPLITERNAMVNLAESGDAIFLEAAFYGGASAPTFRTAVDLAQRYLADLHRMLFVLDVAAARRSGVKPFPNDTAPESAVVEPTLVAPAATDLSLPDALTTARDGDRFLDTTDHAPARVKKWKSALLDLTTRNRLLNLRPSREVIYLHLPGNSLAHADDLVHDGVRLTLRPGDDFAGIQVLSGVRSVADIDNAEIESLLVHRHEVFAAVTDAKYASTFKHLQRTARTMLEETGNTNLYMTFGSLVHSTPSGKEAHAPLFVLPVKVSGGSGRSRFDVVIDTTGVAEPNHCLIEWLRIQHNVTIPTLSSPPMDDSGLDIPAALAGVRQALLEYNLDARIDETATLSICKFGTLGLWRDLQDSWDQLATSPLVHHLTHNAGSHFSDPNTEDDVPIRSLKVAETDHPLPVPYDGSQLKAIEASARGRTFVLEGPPGTGKSQTITNLIARNLAAGRTVLFVAEKQAALDVVRRRLESVGLGPFALNLHGASQKADSIRQQLKDSLDFHTEYNDRSWRTAEATWRSRQQRLEPYPDAIHATNTAGDSLWSATEYLLEWPAAPSYDIPDAFVASASQAEIDAVRDVIVEFSRTAQTGDIIADHPWTIATDVADDESLSTAITDLVAARTRLDADPAALAIAQLLDDPIAITRLIDRARTELATGVISNEEVARFTDSVWNQQFDAAVQRLNAFAANATSMTASFHTPFLENGDHAAIITAIREASSGIFGKKKRAEEATLKLREALHPGVDLPLNEALDLLSYVPSLRAERAAVGTDFDRLLDVRLPSGWEPLEHGACDRILDVRDRLLAAGRFARDHQSEWSTLRSTHWAPASIDALTNAVSAWSAWAHAVGATSESLAQWRGTGSWIATWADTLPQWTADIAASGGTRPRRRIQLIELLKPVRRLGLAQLADDLLTGRASTDDADIRYTAGVARASVAERVATGGLAEFTAQVQDGRVTDFTEASVALRNRMSKDLPGLITQRRPFTPDNLHGSYGELRRALNGKRNAQSVRSLVHKYGAEIISATPCFLVSPSSLAQYVPPGSLTFDLVVFDEASQVTVAQSIGALGRARAAVIVGDSKQMPPTLIGVAGNSTSDEDDDEDGAEVVPDDLESILTEAVESGIEQLWLTWHYRSRDESLIAFSNEKYYEAKLSSLPSPGKDDRSGVEVRRVNGHFNRENRKVEHRTNRVEAEAIVAEVERLVAHGDRSIGVVTFNAQQQDLVLNLLESSGNPVVRSLLAPDVVDGLFVKNLENVQGDERDVILFSTAFSKPTGKDQLPLNFGPLSRTGGEKRLNVAVTRAKRKVVMFTSFDPTDIDLNRTSSVGLTHLRGYMEAALSGADATTAATSRKTNLVETDIAESLREAGLEVQAAFGMSEFCVDLAVKSPQSPNWQIAVMLDGPRWLDRSTVTDRDVMPGLLESMMGWDDVVRIWLPSWLEEPATNIARIVAAVDSAEEERVARKATAAAIAEQPVEAATADPEPEPVVVELAPELAQLKVASQDQTDRRRSMRVASSVTAELPSANVRVVTEQISPVKRVKYVSVDEPPLGAREDLSMRDSARVQILIRNALEQTIDFEGPVEVNELCARVVRRFGYDRARANYTDFVRTMVPADQVRPDVLGTFAWPTTIDPQTWTTFRIPVSGGRKRPADEIPPEEIVNALVYCLKGGPLDFDRLTRSMYAEFDMTRITANLKNRAEACLARAVDSGRVVFSGGMYRLE